MQFAKLQCSCYINSWSISEFKNSYHHDPPHQCAIWDPFSHLSFSNFDRAQVGMSTSNRWSCTTLGAGLKHVDDAAMAAEEKQLLAELEDPRMMIFLKKQNCWNDDPTAFCRHTSLGQFLDSSEPFEGFRYADQPEEQPTCPFSIQIDWKNCSTNTRRLIDFVKLAKVDSDGLSVAETVPAESPAVVLWCHIWGWGSLEYYCKQLIDNLDIFIKINLEQIYKNQPDSHHTC